MRYVYYTCMKYEAKKIEMREWAKIAKWMAAQVRKEIDDQMRAWPEELKIERAMMFELECV